MPGYLMTVWLGVVAPAGTPQPVVERIHALVEGMLKDADRAEAHGRRPAST